MSFIKFMYRKFNFVLITPVNKPLPACPPVYPSERHGRAGAVRQPDPSPPERICRAGERIHPGGHVFLAGTGTYPPVPIRAGSGRFGQVPFGTGGNGKIQGGVKASAF